MVTPELRHVRTPDSRVKAKREKVELLAVREPRIPVGPINQVPIQFSAYFISNEIMIISFVLWLRVNGSKANTFTVPLGLLEWWNSLSMTYIL